jgi:hypothetical protein
MTKLMMASTCSSVVGRFDGHGGLPVRYKAHCLMQHVQGYSGSHWMLASGNYLLRIAPAATRAKGKQTTINKSPTKLAVLMAMAMRRYVTAPITQWRRSRALLEATGCHHWATIMPDNIKGTWLRCFFLMFTIVKTILKTLFLK